MESVGRKYLRRVVTIPSCALLFATVWSALPLLLGLAALVDVVRGRGFVVIRTVTCIAWYLACEIAGLVFALALWVVYRLSARRGREAFVRRNHRLLDLWARAVGRVSFRLFSLDFFVEGDEAFGRRPVLLLLRHASVVDAVLVALLVSGVRGIRLRYVFERKLLWDPFVDVVGNRLPNYFVPRGGVHTIQQIDAAAHVADGMAAGEGAVIYPEEAKFSSTVRKRLIEEFRERGDECSVHTPDWSRPLRFEGCGTGNSSARRFTSCSGSRVQKTFRRIEILSKHGCSSSGGLRTISLPSMRAIKPEARHSDCIPKEWELVESIDVDYDVEFLSDEQQVGQRLQLPRTWLDRFGKYVAGPYGRNESSCSSASWLRSAAARNVGGRHLIPAKVTPRSGRRRATERGLNRGRAS
jgi:1-acyl-sn-glycerol-3-phosphate acyltransferase